MAELNAIITIQYPGDDFWTARYLPLPNITKTADTPEESIAELREEFCRREYRCLEWIQKGMYDETHI